MLSHDRHTSTCMLYQVVIRRSFIAVSLTTRRGVMRTDGPARERRVAASVMLRVRQLALLPLFLLVMLCAQSSDAGFVAVPPDGVAAAPPVSSFIVDYLRLYEEGVNKLPSLNVADPMILAALWSRTGNDTYAAAAANNLAGIVTGDAPWLAANRAWADPVKGRQSWIEFDRNTTTFCSTSTPGACHGASSSGFLGCTEYGLLAYLVLQRGGYEKGWSAKVEADYKAMHSTLCYVWFSGAWNQGTWMGIGNTIFTEAFPDAADETTPWQYPYMTRRQHALKVYRDYFDEQVMMEDADGYNQIWVDMMLTWPEIWKEDRTQQLMSAGTRNLLANFRDYIAPDNRIFQFSSGLGSHYTSVFWLAAMERAAAIFQDGTFRFAAQQIWHSLSQQNTTGPDQNMASCVSIPHGKPGSCCPAAGCLPEGGVSSTDPLALVVTTPWMVSYTLLCAGYDPQAPAGGAVSGKKAGCGPGGVNASLVPTEPPHYRVPSSVVHTRREVGDLQMADKVVMSHTKEFGTNRSFVTVEAHTGRSLWHSHALQTTAIDNYWASGARFLGAQGKHNFAGGGGNHVVMRKATRNAAGTPGFPFRNASDQYKPGEFSTQFLPTHTHLPFLDAAGPLYLKRNLSVLGFSCDNWLNHTVNLTILPIVLHGPAGELVIDDFTPATAHLWADGAGSVVQNSASPSGWALQIVCAANTTSCGPLATKPLQSGGLCPPGCVSDGDSCQSEMTTFVVRAPSVTHPLPTELDAGNWLDVRDFRSFDLRWKLSSDYRPPDVRDSCFPFGMQTVDFAPQSNRTLSYYGNDVKQLSGCTDPSCNYKGVNGHPHKECLSDGEYWPLVNQQETGANVKGEDLYSTVAVDSGYFTSGTGTTRQIIALAEGSLVVVDSLLPDANAVGWLGGPSWQMAVDNDLSELIHAGAWPVAQERLNVTWRQANAFEFDGFAEVYNSGCTAGQGSIGPFGCNTRQPSSVRLVLVFPNLTNDETVDLAEGEPDSTCGKEGTCPLYFPRAASRTRVLRAGQEEHFVSVFLPNVAGVDPKLLADGVSVSLSQSHAEVSLASATGGGKMRVRVQLGGEQKQNAWRVDRTRTGEAA